METLTATGTSLKVTYLNGWLTVRRRVGGKSIERFPVRNVARVDHRVASRLVQGHLNLHMTDGREVKIIYRHGQNDEFGIIADALTGVTA